MTIEQIRTASMTARRATAEVILPLGPLRLIRPSELVHIEEAERRAEICATCVENWLDCPPCAELRQPYLVGRHGQTRRDAELGYCRVTRRRNRVDIWVPPEVILQHLSPEAAALLPEGCWKVDLKAG